ncbi:MAG: YcjF family protein [Hyphomicrobiales bacterium]|nr:YcjF family protein [Hyphomicrobiales bacterium]
MTTQMPRGPRIFQPGDSRMLPAEELPSEGEGAEDATSGETAADRGSSSAMISLMRLRRVGWGTILLSALGGLFSIGISIWITNFVADLFARSGWLGYLAVTLAGIAGLAAIVIIFREFLGFFRLARIASIRLSAQMALDAGDKKQAEQTTRQLEALFLARGDVRSGIKNMARHRREVLEARELLILGERELMQPLDREARRMISASVGRVALITAVSPSAIIDVVFVAIENLAMLRRLATLYGGRPGGLGSLKLARLVLGHIALTGGVALGEDVIQQLVGHGLTAKLSTRLGEGVINGAFTGRIGISAVDLCRPLPFIEAERPKLRNFIAELRRSQPADGSVSSSGAGSANGER